MHFTCRAFLGSHNSYNWSQNWENEPDDFGLKTQKGHLFGLINLHSELDNPDLSKMGHAIIESVNLAYYDNPANIPQSLDQAMKSIAPNSIEASIILATVVGEKIYFTLTENASILFIRGDKISKFNTALTGLLQDGDQIFLCTQNFISSLGWSKVKSILHDSSLSSIEENFLSLLINQDDQNYLAASLIQVHFDKVSIDLPQNDPAPKNVFVPPHTPPKIFKRHKKNNLILAIGLLTILMFCFILGFKKNQLRELEKKYFNLANQIDQNLKNIETIKNLNFQSAQDEAKKTQDLINKAMALKTHSQELISYQKQVQSLLSQTGSAADFIPEEIYDTSLIADNINYFQLSFVYPNIYLFDKSIGRIDSLDFQNKSKNNIVINDQIKDAITITSDNNKIFLLTSKKILEIKKNEIVSTYEFENDVSPVDFTFWNHILYLLDSQKPTIYKVSPNLSNWLKDDLTLSPSPTSLAINGQVWVLSQNGTITPYLQGKKDNFKPSQSPSCTTCHNLVVSPDTDLMAYTDADTVYVYKKNGQSLGKYSFKSPVADIAINEKDNFIFVLATDKKIYKIPL